MAALFTIPIPPLGPHPGGTLTLTTPAPKVYLLTLTSPPDNRLTTPVCRALLQALDIIETRLESGVVVTTSGIPKFYSNGLDLEHAMGTEGFFSESLYAVFKRFITFPMPTIALLNGHAFAGGLMTAMHHDYRIANPSKGLYCLNELDFGVALPPGMSSVFRIKLTPQSYRTLVLEAHRFTGKTALEAGIVDALGGLEDVLSFIEGRKLVEKGKSGIYRDMKREMYKEAIRELEPGMHERRSAEERVWQRGDEERRGRVGAEVGVWERELRFKL